MNMLILKLGDMLSFELQQRQLSKSGILTVVCCVCMTVVSVGPVIYCLHALICVFWGGMLVLRECFPSCILVCLPTFISVERRVHVDSFN